MELQLRGTTTEAISFDGSRNLFRAGAIGPTAKVSELLHAIPMLKAEPIAATADNAADALFTMKVTVQRINGSVPQADYYDNTSATLPEFTS